MGTLDSQAVRLATVIALAAGVAVAVPMACAFPSYTYDLPNGAGGSTASTTTGQGSATTAASMTTTMSTSATGNPTASTTSGTTTTSTSAASSSTGGPPCATANCADETCKDSFTCVPLPSNLPSGWMGYFALYDGDPSDVPPCGSIFPTTGFAGNGGYKAPPATTCPCTCDPPSGGTCQYPELDISDAACNLQGVCTGPIIPPTGYVDGDCFNFPDPSSGFDEFGGTTCGTQMQGATSCTTGTANCNVSAAMGTSKVTGGSCTPSAINPDAPPVPWATSAQSCGGATAGTGCGSSDACMPIPPGPFHSGICITQTGSHTCPPGQFTEQHLLYSGTDDTRSCTACKCGTPTGESCTAEYSLFFDNSSPPSCQMSVTTVDTPCVVLNGNPSITSAMATITGGPSGGKCTATNGSPTGSIAPSGETTFCCIP